MSVFSLFRYIFTSIFTLEMVIKVISLGFVINNHAYLRDYWNWLDFGIVVISFEISCETTPQYVFMLE
jgi:hypothetical protein